MSEVRTDKLQGTWADDATVVASTPASPTAGVAYRNTASDATVGFQFNTKSPSEVANQWMYTVSKLLAQLETLGTLGWNTLTTYPVGAITMSSDGAIYQCIQIALNKDPTTQSAYWTKLDVLNRAMTSLSNITTVACAKDSTAKTVPDVVVEYWIATDGLSWYRLYKSGWVEQGGRTGLLAAQTGLSVTFVKAFTDSCFHVNYIGETPTGPDYGDTRPYILTKSKTAFTLISGWDSIYVNWFACGF